MTFFKNIAEAPLDPILGLNVSFAADERKNKVNLGAGVYKTEDLKPFILKTVKKAETLLVENEKSKDYLPIDGLADYVNLTKELIFEKKEASIYGAQTVGGTAALCIGARFLKEAGLSKIYISSPTWANHNRIFQQAHLDVQTYTYFNWEKRDFDYSAFMDALGKMPRNAIVLLQVCCHNPTGLDPTLNQWQEICQTMQERGLFPFFDFAYQGFGEGLEKDRAVLSLFLNNGLEYAVAVSHAKNFGLYAERCGVLFFVSQNREISLKIGSRIKVIIRSLYSNPPSHGARIVATILQNFALKSEWIEELESMRKRITELRAAFIHELQTKTAIQDFDFLAKQKGMFSYTGLKEDQVKRLIAEYGIYMPLDGRMNVAGLNARNLKYVTDAIHIITQ